MKQRIEFIIASKSNKQPLLLLIKTTNNSSYLIWMGGTAIFPSSSCGQELKIEDEQCRTFKISKD
jgi:hypothetical protein